ncbi:alpha/beta hydrolase [Pseudactinotalea terrae]|uniref:alpha/beta hydrolase n=1 Tax=Pseudactinotalea terrae TaxID=1743262 RepID=UPI0012E2E50E|nr:alpha/beta hydrolase-fold protein [Pseudactinotalea terrae]
MHAGTRGDGRLEFRLPDPERSYSRVRLDAGLGTTGDRPDLTWADGAWSVTVDLPPLHRIEYGFEVTGTITDPANPALVDTGFGNRSVVELPGYRAPAWVAREVPSGTTTAVAADVEGVTAALWSPDGLGDDALAPLLVVHDGPDYAERGELTRYLGVLAEEGAAPPTRALLLTADPRELHYAASEAYADTLVTELIPSARHRWPTTATIAVGASLGAIAALHAQWRHPGTFDALLLQSGSFFTPQTDPQESGFARWPELTGFVTELHTQAAAGELPPIALTCGSHEENALNNRLLAQRLREVGVAVTYTEVPDLHNFTCWRDGLDPALRNLLAAAG